MRKCKKVVDNIFFLPFSERQPNTKKYFHEYFQ